MRGCWTTRRSVALSPSADPTRPVARDRPTMATADLVTPFIDRYHAARTAGLPGEDLPWLEQLRADGIARLKTLGLPTRRVEEWKFTDIRKLAAADFQPAPAIDGALHPDLAYVLAEETADVTAVLVFVNGRFRADLSRTDGLPAGVTLGPLNAALAKGDPAVATHFGRVLPDVERIAASGFLGLSTAMASEGAVLCVPDGVTVDGVIAAVFLSDNPGENPVITHPRLLSVIGANAEATVVETHAGRDGAGPTLTNFAGELAVGDGARYHHYRLIRDGARGYHLANSHVRVGRDAHTDTFVLTLTGALTRSEVNARLIGRGGDLRVSGGYVGDGRRHIDNTSLIDHAVPDCRSRQVFKGVLDDASRGVFQGKIIVRRDAQRTDGYQLNRALLLTRKAEIDSKPELEIYADDVKCSHGATAGEIDNDALFYLRARGIPERTARRLLVEAFLAEVLEEIGAEPVRERFTALAAQRLNAHAQPVLEEAA